MSRQRSDVCPAATEVTVTVIIIASKAVSYVSDQA
jgi:hypothetical protein